MIALRIATLALLLGLLAVAPAHADDDGASEEPTGDCPAVQVYPWPPYFGFFPACLDLPPTPPVQQP